MFDGINFGQAIASGSVAGVLFAFLAALMRLLFAREKAEYARLEKRITELEIARDLCLEKESLLQRQLGEMEAKLQAIAPGPIAHITADANETITEWNPGATILFGWSQEEAIGRSVTMLIPPRLRQRHVDAFHQAAHEHRGPSERAAAAIRESNALRRDGSEIPVTITLTGWQYQGKQFYSAEIRKR